MPSTPCTPYFRLKGSKASNDSVSFCYRIDVRDLTEIPYKRYVVTFHCATGRYKDGPQDRFGVEFTALPQGHVMFLVCNNEISNASVLEFTFKILTHQSLQRRW